MLGSLAGCEPQFERTESSKIKLLSTKEKSKFSKAYPVFTACGVGSGGVAGLCQTVFHQDPGQSGQDPGRGVQALLEAAPGPSTR